MEEEGISPTAVELSGRVLLAEDNPVNQTVALEMLAAVGVVNAKAVANGREALRALAEGAFDLILMDCQMPVMDGFQATGEIRRREAASGEGARIPVIALTANAMAGDRERCLAAGMDDYLAKPFSRFEIGAILSRWLEPCAGKEAPAVVATPADEIRATGAVGEAIPRPESEVSGTSAKASPEPRRLDQHALANIRVLQRDGGTDVLAKVITLYLQTTPRLLDTLNEASDAEDRTLLARTAHTLKSSSATLGATHLAALCKKLETMARAGSDNGGRELIVDIAAEYQRVAVSLRTEIRKKSA